MIRITNPEEFIQRMETLLYEATSNPAKQYALGKKIPNLEKIRDYFVQNAPSSLDPAVLNKMNDLLEYARGGAVTVETNPEENGSSGGDLLVKRLIVPGLSLILGIYLYQSKEKLPNLEGLTNKVQKTVLPALAAKLSKIWASIEVPKPMARHFKPGIQYWQEASKITWGSYDARLVLLAGVGALGLALAVLDRKDPEKEINFYI